MSEADDGDKQFDPTPQRRDQYRKDGRFPRARDAGGIATTAAVLAVLLGSRGVLSHAASLLFTGSHGDLGALGRIGGERVLSMIGGTLMAMAAPSAIAAAFAAGLIGLAQTRLEVREDILEFKFERLNPVDGIKRLLSFKHGATEVMLGLLRVGVVGWVAWRALIHDLPALMVLSRMPAEAAAERCIEAVVRMTLHALLTLAVVAAIDYGWSWWSLEREMKMTKKEIIDEHKSNEGDPQMKNRLRARGRAMIRARSIANVKKADVVVTNPTHIAVALRYAATDAAPVVVSKGHDAAAMQIRAEARKHGIPILENRPLARALDAEVPIGHPVPGKHFAAVARVLAWVYRIRPSARRVKRPRA